MSVRHRQKHKKEKKADISASKAEVKPQPSDAEIRKAFGESAKLFFLAQLLPLKLEICDERRRVCLSSFLLSAKFEKSDRGFSYELCPSLMTADDYAKLLKTVYAFYQKRLGQ